MEFIQSLLGEPLILLFVILFLGSWFGMLTIRGLSLGAAGVLLVAMMFGHFGYAVSPIVQNLGLSLFIVAIGLQAGPRFFPDDAFERPDFRYFIACHYTNFRCNDHCCCQSISVVSRAERWVDDGCIDKYTWSCCSVTGNA